MTQNHHTPIPSAPPQPANAETINAPLGELDAAITNHETRIQNLENEFPPQSGNPTEYLDGTGNWSVPSGTGAGIDGHVIQIEGVDLPQRAKLNFVGAGVTVTNEAGGTQVNIPGATGGVQSVVAGAGIAVDNTDLENPVVSALAGSIEAMEGVLINGKITVTVASGNITLAIKTAAGNDPSTLDKVIVKINGTNREITSALSVTVNAGANTFQAGSSELATQEVDYFAYVSWRVASNAVVLGFSRIPYARLYSDFSATATNEKYAAFSAAPASTDDVVVCGRFAATLSAAPGYTWTVPIYTNIDLIQRPIWETRWLNWKPTITGYSTLPSLTVYRYRLVNNTIMLIIRETTNGIKDATTSNPSYSTPFTSINITNYQQHGIALMINNNTFDMIGALLWASGNNFFELRRSQFQQWTANQPARCIGGNIIAEI